MKKYKIIQDVANWDDPSGLYLVIDIENDKILQSFDFKKEAMQYLMELKAKPTFELSDYSED